MAQSVIDYKQQFFDGWAPTYDWLLPSVFYQAVHQRLLEYVVLPETAYVLDLGCGTGRLLRRLASQFPTLTGLGLDLSENMLAQARQKPSFRDRLQFVSGRSDFIPADPETFDAVFCTISFLHYPEPQAVMADVARVLKPGAMFYLADYVPSQFLGLPQRSWLLSPTGLRFYSKMMRQDLAEVAGLTCQSHHCLLGPIMLTVCQCPFGLANP
ncbi:MAG: class I SAM-dependent methyltransferase [Cyanobacteria bacterium P01_A01_bin.123]